MFDSYRWIDADAFVEVERASVLPVATVAARRRRKSR